MKCAHLSPADLTPTEFPLSGGLTVGEISDEHGNVLVGVAVLWLLENTKVLLGEVGEGGGN